MRAAAICSGVLIAAALGGPSFAAAPATHCAAGEKVIYSCAFGHKVASICLAPKTVTYRYGPLGRPELEIASNGADGRVFQDVIMGAGGSSEDSVRFVNNGYNYLIYVETRGALADPPNTISSAVEIYKGTEPAATLTCQHTDTHHLNLELPAFVPREPENGDFDSYH